MTTTYTERGQKLLDRLKKIAEVSKGNDISKIRQSLVDLKKLQEEVNGIIEEFRKTYNKVPVPPIMEMNKWAKPKNFKGLEKILSAAQLKTVQEGVDVDDNGKFEADEQQFALDLYNSVGGNVDLFMKKVKKIRAVTKAVREKLKTSSFATSILKKAGVSTFSRATSTNITKNEAEFISTVVTKKFILDEKEISENISRDFGSWFRSQQKGTFPQFSEWIKNKNPDPKIKVIKKFPQSEKNFMTRKLGEFPNNRKSLFTMHSQKRKITGTQKGNSVPLPANSSSLKNIYSSLPDAAKKNLANDMAFYKTRKPKTWNEYINFTTARRELGTSTNSNAEDVNTNMEGEPRPGDRAPRVPRQGL